MGIFKKTSPDRNLLLLFVLLFMVVATSTSVSARAYYDGRKVTTHQKILNADPNLQYGVHLAGNVGLTITNLGMFGTGYISETDCDGEVCPSCEYPVNSDLEYLYAGAVWIGAVVGQDTLVSVGADGWYGGITELLPDAGEAGAMTIQSNNPALVIYSPDAVSELEYKAVYTDTFTDPNLTDTDPFDNRPHIPLNVRVQQNSYSWSRLNDRLDDFVLFEYILTNIGLYPIQDMYIGFFVDGDVYHMSNQANGFQDDISGFLPEENIAYTIDNDGDPIDGNQWSFTSPRGVMGFKFHAPDPDIYDINFNWWISNANPALDFGPRLAGTEDDPFRPFNAHLGTPTGDANKYYVLSHPEHDYDQLFTAVSHEADGFLPPPSPAQATDFADGFDTKFLYSFGPFTLEPGETSKLYFSVVMGDNLHVDPGDFANYFDPANPQAFYDRLDFSDLIANANIADSVYRALFADPLDVDDNHPPAPAEYTLSDNYPNPFNPATTIEYTLARQGHVEISVFDLLGRRVRTLVDGTRHAGAHSVDWDGLDDNGQPAATGIYFYRIETDQFSQTKKMMLLK